MANRRMIARSVVDTDYFLDLPLSAQALYYYLNIIADDDGFVVSPKRAVMMVGACVEDLEHLVSKGYIIRFDSGVCVVRHWLMNNQLQKDRYTPTTCTEEKKCLLIKKGVPYELLKAKIAAEGEERNA